MGNRYGDISHNFMICGDGSVLEGKEFDTTGAFNIGEMKAEKLCDYALQ